MRGLQHQHFAQLCEAVRHLLWFASGWGGAPGVHLAGMDYLYAAPAQGVGGDEVFRKVVTHIHALGVWNLQTCGDQLKPAMGWFPGIWAEILSEDDGVEISFKPQCFKLQPLRRQYPSLRSPNFRPASSSFARISWTPS